MKKLKGESVRTADGGGVHVIGWNGEVSGGRVTDNNDAHLTRVSAKELLVILQESIVKAATTNRTEHNSTRLNSTQLAITDIIYSTIRHPNNTTEQNNRA